MNGFKRQVTPNFRTNVPANVPQNMFTKPGSHLEGCEVLLESLIFAKCFLKFLVAVRLWNGGIHQGRPEHGDINRLHILVMGPLPQHSPDLHPEENYTAPSWEQPGYLTPSSALTLLTENPTRTEWSNHRAKNQCQCKKTLELCNSPRLAECYWDWVIVPPSTAAWSEKPAYFHLSVCNSLLGYFIWTQKGNPFLTLDSGSDYGFSHKEFIISEIKLAK